MSGLVPVCDRIITYNKSTAVLPGYEGIPQNLLINFIGWLVLLFIFSVLRKSAWDYGRIALTKPRHNKWATLFYSEVRAPASRDSPLSSTTDRDSGLFSWLRLFFTLSNADLQNKCGLDAVHYLRFQGYLIIYTAITMVICLGVILPLNITGTLKSPDLQNFGVTTISNLPGESLLLWVHVSFGVVFFSIAFALMQHFSKRFWNEASLLRLVSFRTLMISGIPKPQRDREILRQYFSEAFPGCDIDDVQVCCDIGRLVSLESKLESVMSALAYSQRYLVRKGCRLMIIPRCCGLVSMSCRRHCCCQPQLDSRVPELPSDEPVVLRPTMSSAVDSSCCRSDSVDAINFYSNEVNRLQRQIEEENATALERTIGIAFVTFHHRQSALRVYKTFRQFFQRPSSRSLPGITGAYFWHVQFAPTPNNIIWPNLAVTQLAWWSRAIVVNLVVLILVFFLTTPTYVLNLLNRIPQIAQIDNAFINQFLPSIILWLVSALLPSIVFNSDWLVRHWTHSVLNLTVMVKTFTLLILMVLVLPSLGLTSISALLQWLFPVMHLIPIGPPANTTLAPQQPVAGTVSTESEPWVPINKQTFQWECVFVPDNGAFFVNYVITSALIGTALTLARIPELAMYMFRIMVLRSKAERITARKLTQYEFQFGLQYAWTLCVFAVISAYSILCPLITPFGLLYLILRYLVDRYNLFFAYLPSHVDSRTHWLAMICMLASVGLLQFNLLMFIILRLGPLTNPLSIVALVGVVVSAFLWLSSIVTGWIFVGSAPMRYRGPSLAASPGATLTEASQTTQWEAMTLRALGTVPRATYAGTLFDQEHEMDSTNLDGAVEPQLDTLRSGDEVLTVNVRRTPSTQTNRVPMDQPDDGWLTLSRVAPTSAPTFVRTIVDNSKPATSLSSSDEN